MNETYQPNSRKFKEEQREAAAEKKKIEKVVTGTVKAKKNGLRKVTDIFISEDAKNVKSYIFMDVLVPAIKKAVSDIVRDGIDMILYGGTNGGKRETNASKISYRNYYDRRDSDRRYSSDSNRTRTSYSYDDIVLQYRGEAEDVLTRMSEIIESYGVVSVMDLYDLVGITGNYTDNKYGWTNISNASVERVRDGYMLKLPRALPID